MKKYCTLFILFPLLFCVESYGFNLLKKNFKPEFFGVYLLESDALKELKAVRLGISGNLMSSFGGLHDYPAIACTNSEASIIFYKENIPYQDIALLKLRYQSVGYVDNIVSPDLTIVDMWVPIQKVDIQVAPIKGENNMYRIVPAQKLEEGVYCIAEENIGKQATLGLVGGKNMVYPFRLGDNTSNRIPRGMKLKNVRRFIIEAEQKKNSRANFINTIETLNSRMENQKNTIFGIYPIKDSTRIVVDISPFKNEILSSLLRSTDDFMFTILADQYVSGTSVFMLRSGGALIDIVAKEKPDVDFEKFVAIKLQNAWCQKNLKDGQNYFIWIQRNEYAQYKDTYNGVTSFIEKALGKPGDKYNNIRRIELMYPRSNEIAFVK